MESVDRTDTLSQASRDAALTASAESLPVESKRSNPLPTVLLVLLAVGSLAIFLLTAVVAFQKYSPMQGVAGSPFVGLANFQRVLSLPQAPQILGNSVVLRLVEIAVGLALGIPVALGISCIRSRRLSVALSCLCLIPALLPDITIVSIMREWLSRQMVTTGSNYPVLYALQSVLPQAGIMAFAGGIFATLKRHEGRGGLWKGITLVTGLWLLAALTANYPAVLLSQNPMNLQYSDTLSTYEYRMGLQQSNLSMGAALSVLRMAAQLVVALIVLLWLRKMLPERAVQTMRGGQPKRFFAAAKALPVALIMVLVVALWIGALAFFSLPQDNVILTMSEQEIVAQTEQMIRNQTVQSAARASVVGLLLALPLGLLVGYAFLRGISGRKTYGFAAIALLTLSGGIVGPYLAMRTAGLINTALAPVLSAMASPKATMLLLVCAAVILHQSHAKRILPAVIGTALLLAAIVWGDHMGGILYLVRGDLMPAGTAAYRTVMTGAASAEGVEMSLESIQFMRGSLLGLVFLPAVALSALGAGFWALYLKD